LDFDSYPQGGIFTTDHYKLWVFGRSDALSGGRNEKKLESADSGQKKPAAADATAGSGT
jgi:hypothetical protein